MENWWIKFFAFNSIVSPTILRFCYYHFVILKKPLSHSCVSKHWSLYLSIWPWWVQILFFVFPDTYTVNNLNIFWSTPEHRNKKNWLVQSISSSLGALGAPMHQCTNIKCYVKKNRSSCCVIYEIGCWSLLQNNIIVMK